MHAFNSYQTTFLTCKDKKKQWKHNNNNNSTQNKSEKNETKAKESNKATLKHDNKIFGKKFATSQQIWFKTKRRDEKLS